MKQYVFYEPILYANVIVRITKNPESCLSGSVHVEERMGKKGKEVRYVVTLEDKKDFYTLQHELVHVTKQIFVDRKIPFNAENDEMIAYYFEHWFKTIWRRINK